MCGFKSLDTFHVWRDICAAPGRGAEPGLREEGGGRRSPGRPSTGLSYEKLFIVGRRWPVGSTDPLHSTVIYTFSGPDCLVENFAVCSVSAPLTGPDEAELAISPLN